MPSADPDGYVSLTKQAPDTGPTSSVTFDKPASSRKLRSHATRLGFHAHNYVPEHVKTKTLSALSLLSKRGGDAALEQITLEVEDLKKAGLTIDELTQYVYEHLNAHELPNFLCNLHLDEDGGLDRVKTLWNNVKVLQALMLLCFLIMNVCYLLSSNWTVFHGFWEHFVTAQVQHAIHGHIRVNSNMTSEALEAAGGAAMDHGESKTIYAHITDPERRGLILQMGGIVSTCEVLRVLLSIFYAIYQALTFVYNSSEYRAFTEIMNLFQVSLPVLSTFSLMKYMSSVHPALIYDSYQKCLHEKTFHGVTGTVVASVYFGLTTIVLGSLSMLAFGMKLLSVGLKLIDKHCQLPACLFAVVGFMNQCMGCVLFERVLQDRLFLFIFGGSDTDFREDELALKGVYRCRIAKQIWEDFWKRGERVKAIVLLATLDHYDLQRLLINEPEEHEVRSRTRSFGASSQPSCRSGFGSKQSDAAENSLDP